VYVAHVRPGSQGLHHGTAESGLLRLEELRNRVESLPGVRSAALITENFPFAGSAVVWPVELPGQDTREALSARVGAVTPGYFATLGLRTTRGRLIDATDHVGSSSVVVLSEQAARVFFPGRDPVGETMDLGRTVRVVGVVTDVRDWGPESGVDVNGALVYVPLAQFPSPDAFMLVKATTGQGNVATTVNAAIRDAYPDMALVPVLPYSDYLRPFIVQRQFNMIVIGIFAALGLAVACIGVQGVTAYVVVQRTKEIGIRRALGGAVAAVIWSVLRATTAQVMTGVAIGVAAALYLGTFAGEFLFQTDPRDPWLYAAAGTLFLVCALIAAVAPARRAARVDPATVLRLD
jgi:ABC-type antimicrobial peptide transport system permease subunit